MAILNDLIVKGDAKILGNFSGPSIIATKLSTNNVGAGNNPVYFYNGIPMPSPYTIEKSVPSDAVFTDTTYTAGTGLSLSGTTINHSNSITAGTAKGDASKTLSFGGTFTVPTISYDAQGHITGIGKTTMTIPSLTIDSALSSTSTNSLQNNVIYNALNSKFDKSGGTIDGAVYIRNANALQTRHIDGDTHYSGDLYLNWNTAGSPIHAYGPISSNYTLSLGAISNYGQLVMYHPSGTKDIMFRYDGNNFYVLLSDTRGGQWNSARPLTINTNGICNINGNAATATSATTASKLATARTISLTGSVTGSGTFDGSGNLSIATTTNHTHSYLPLSGGTLSGDLKLAPSGSAVEGGQLELHAPSDDSRISGVILDNWKGRFRIFGIPSKDGTSRTGVGSVLTYDPYTASLDIAGVKFFSTKFKSYVVGTFSLSGNGTTTISLGFTPSYVDVRGAETGYTINVKAIITTNGFTATGIELTQNAAVRYIAFR